MAVSIKGRHKVHLKEEGFTVAAAEILRESKGRDKNVIGYKGLNFG